ncbi:MAG: AAA family ATPase [Candidatus Woykebacteria bacterium]
MIIGVVGSLGVGKSTLVEYLVSEKGFTSFRLSNVIREKYGKQDMSREELQDGGNALRKKFGQSVLADETWEKIKEEDKNVVIDGLRNTGEVEFFRSKGRVYLISIGAPKKVRFERMKERSSERDPKNWQEFLKMDTRDLDESFDFGQQTLKMMQIADFKLKNDGTIKELYIKIDEILNKI